MKSIAITGCNRGIGFGLVKHFIKTPGSFQYLFATYRDPNNIQDLADVASENKRVHLCQLDLNQFDQYNAFAEYIDSVTQDEGLNVLINNAGVSTKFTRVNLVKVDQMTENFLTNAVAPLMLTKALIPLLKRASMKNNTKAIGIQRAAVINMSSILGSISNNAQGGFYPYRTSKAALNAITRSLSIDLKDDGILVASLHPGWVKTDMGGANADLTLDFCVEAVVNTLKTLNEDHSGKFIQYDGVELPW